MLRARKNKKRSGKIFFCLVLILVLLSLFVLFWGADNWYADNKNSSAVCTILKPVILLKYKLLKIVGFKSRNSINVGSVENSSREDVYRDIDADEQKVEYDKSDTNYLDKVIKKAKGNRD